MLEESAKPKVVKEIANHEERIRNTSTKISASTTNEVPHKKSQ
jgi:hypothetical protein